MPRDQPSVNVDERLDGELAFTGLDRALVVDQTLAGIAVDTEDVQYD